jgi:hypothetical protein
MNTEILAKIKKEIRDALITRNYIEAVMDIQQRRRRRLWSLVAMIPFVGALLYAIDERIPPCLSFILCFGVMLQECTSLFAISENGYIRLYALHREFNIYRSRLEALFAQYIGGEVEDGGIELIKLIAEYSMKYIEVDGLCGRRNKKQESAAKQKSDDYLNRVYLGQF